MLLNSLLAWLNRKNKLPPEVSFTFSQVCNIFGYFVVVKAETLPFMHGQLPSQHAKLIIERDEVLNEIFRLQLTDFFWS